MRLFIGVRFPAGTVRDLEYSAAALRDLARSGVYVPSENYHATLCFIGECDRSFVKKAEGAMKEALRDTKRFSAHFTESGCFSRTDGKIVWIGMESGGEMEKMHDAIVASLEKVGFRLEDESKKNHYVPHITLARRADMKQEDLSHLTVSQAPFEVASVSLMLSSVIHGRVRYSDLTTVRLK